MSFQSGHKLSHYEILGSIGRGGMGEVYRAKDAKLGREVAIKTLPEEFSRNEERLARFNREAKVLASLNHPNIAAIYGLEETDGSHYLVLELVEGETLAERIARGPIPLEEALEIAVKIADALEEAHERGVVHRDLKPANIKCTPDDRVKVLDFGLAKALAEETPNADLSMSPTITRDATRTGVILGTAAYMSPEQAKGRRVDKRTDIFAFGAVLYEMLSGRKAFPGDDVSEVLAAVIKLEPDWSTLPKGLGPRLEKILHRCLEKDAKKRRRDIADVRSDIEEAQVAPEVTELRRGVEGRTRLPRALGAAAILILGFLAAFTAWNLKPTPSRPTMRLAVPLPQGAHFSYRGRQVVALSPDGTQLAFVAGGQIYLRPLDQMEAVPLPGTERARSPVFSPDGRWVAFYSEGALKKVSVSGGVPIQVAPAGDPFGISWAADDTILYGAGSEGIFRVPAEGGALERLVEVSEGERAYGPQRLPGGKHLLFTLTAGSWEEGSLVTQSLDSGERKALVPGGNDGRYLSSGHLVFAIGNTLMAVPFDPRTLETRGAPVPVVENVARSGTNTAAAHFSYSEDGTLAFVSGTDFGYDFDRASLVWIDRQGVVEPASETLGALKRPRLSPDGERLAVGRGGQGLGGFGDVWILDLERATFSRLTKEGGSSPLWSPDGKWVVFEQDGIHRTRADFSGHPERILSGEVKRPQSWSRDGRWLVFGKSVRIENEDIWLYSFENEEEPRALIDSRYSELSGEISPDGRWIAYYSSESGRGEIYVQPFPGPGAREQVSTDGGMNPAWSRDGQELFFQSSEALYVVEVIPGSAFQSRRPLRLFDLPEGDFGERDWDVSPDGKRFVAILRQGSGADRPVVDLVLDWFQELERLAPTH